MIAFQLRDLAKRIGAMMTRLASKDATRWCIPYISALLTIFLGTFSESGNDAAYSEDYYAFNISRPDCREVGKKGTTEAFIGNSLALVLVDGNRVDIIDLSGQSEHRTVICDFEPIWWACATPTRQELLVLRIESLGDSNTASTIICINILSGKTKWEYECTALPVAFTVSADGERLALAYSIYGEVGPSEVPTPSGYAHCSWIELIDTGTGKQTDVLKCSARDGLASLAFSHDGTSLAVGGGDQCSIVVWDIKTKTERMVFQMPPRPWVNQVSIVSPTIYSVAFSPDDRLLIASGHCPLGVKEEGGFGGGLLFAWDMAEKHVKMVMTTPESVAFGNVCFDPNNNYFITSERRIVGDGALLAKGFRETMTIFKVWSRRDLAPLAEFKAKGDYDLAPLILADGVLKAVSTEPLKKTPASLDVPWIEIPIRVKICEWSLKEYEDFF